MISYDDILSENSPFKGVDHPVEECGVFGVWAPNEEVAR